MKFPPLLAAALCLTTVALRAADTNAPAAGGIENSIVKVFATVRYPDPYKPWAKDSPEEDTGSGVVIEGKRILTNAHVVNYASQVQIQANQAGDKISATVEYLAPGIDLAVLKLEDDKFFDTHPALPRSKTLPAIKDTVLAYGYPEGGTSLSITKGIVSRVEFTGYGEYTSGLRIQIDAAINPGNSGGAAIAGDKMIGLTFSRLNEADNIGYIIPNEEIDLFLQDIADGKYDGKPAMFDALQTLENPALRSYLKLPANTEGMVVHQPYTGAGPSPLKAWDVITKIGQIPIDDQGMIKLDSGLRIRFAYEIQHLAANGVVPLTLVREGKTMDIKLPVSPDHANLIAELSGNTYPSYFIFGPLAFSELTGDYLRGYLKSRYATSFLYRAGSEGNPMVTRLADQPAFPDEHLVVISSPFFPHKLAQGYSSPMGETVKSINGIPVKNLKHLVEILRDSKEEFIRIECNMRYGETMIFPRAQMLAATDDILGDNGVRAQGSPDTLAVWNAKK
jgi:S1-C subfamily serine protease